MGCSPFIFIYPQPSIYRQGGQNGLRYGYPTPLRTFCPPCLFLYGWGFVIKRDSDPVLACLFCIIGCGASSCNLSATLPIATSACRGYICGRFNNFVELSTHTLVLRHSGRHGCGRRIAGTVRKHSGFQFARMEGDMKEKCLCTKGVPGAQKCHSEHKVVVGKKESWLQMYGE